MLRKGTGHMAEHTKKKSEQSLYVKKMTDKNHDRRYGDGERSQGVVPVMRTRDGAVRDVEDEVALVSLLKDSAKRKDLQKGRQIHEAIKNRCLLQKNIFIGSTLVHMYAQCGALVMAQKVFNEIPIQNSVTWNALMTGYLQHGQPDKALDCFERMQGEGTSLDAVTFLSVLRACGATRAISLGEKLSEEILKKGWLRTNSALGGALVDMYAKFGMLEKAQEIFNILPFQTVVSWTALISGYAQHGHGERALSSFDSMRSEGLSPNAITLACVLKACGVVGNLHKGEELHQEINEKCLLRNDNVLGTALVDMYAKCGALAMAQEVFDELSFRDIISWNALISGYCQKGQIDEALRVLEQMKCEGFLPDAATFNCILRTCASVGATGKAKRIHEEIVERDFLGRHHTVLSTALISMYAKGGAFEMAEKVFDDLIIYDVRSTNVLIAGYCQHDCLNEALEHYEQMIRKGFSPDTGTFACLLRACGRTGASENGEELHCEVMRLGISNEHNIIGSALVDMYVRFGHLVKAQGVLDKLAVQDLASWTSLIHGYCQCGQNHEALSGFHKMKEQGLSPDEVTFACILKACGSSCAINKGISIHAEIEREGLMEKFEMLGSALVDMYAKCGATAKAQEVFDKLLNRDLITWTALIDGYCQRGLGEEALYCFDQMRREISSLDAVTFACILKVCGSIGAVERGAILHDEILQNGLLGKDNVLDIALLDMYAKCGALFKAQEVFNDLPVHTVVTWNVLMAGYCQHGNGEEVLKCFDAMKHEGISPDAVTFVTVLKACRRIRALDKSFMYFEMMKKDYDIIPNLEHYSCMIEILGHEGKFEKALNFVRNMPSHEQLEGWSALLSACRKQGNVILGRLAFEHMVQLDQDV